MATLLMTEACLYDLDLSTNLADEIYIDFPSKMLDFVVKDRSKFISDPEDETVLIFPEGLQAKIVDIYSKSHHSRAFIRPSGTQNLIRIYAEAPTQDQADAIAEDLFNLLSDEYNDS